MGWGNKFPDMKNDPSYLEGRLSNAETSLAQKISKGETFLNVKDYGAKGDGTTDDSTAIQNTINAAQNGVGLIYFPAGTYLINTELLISKSLILEGKGASGQTTGGAILKFNNTDPSKACIRIHESVSLGAMGIQLKQLKFTTATNTANQHAIRINNTSFSKFTLDFVSFNEITGYGLFIDGNSYGQNVSISNISFWHCGGCIGGDLSSTSGGTAGLFVTLGELKNINLDSGVNQISPQSILFDFRGWRELRVTTILAEGTSANAGVGEGVIIGIGGNHWTIIDGFHEEFSGTPATNSVKVYTSPYSANVTAGHVIRNMSQQTPIKISATTANVRIENIASYYSTRLSDIVVIDSTSYATVEIDGLHTGQQISGIDNTNQGKIICNNLHQVSTTNMANVSYGKVGELFNWDISKGSLLTAKSQYMFLDYSGSSISSKDLVADSDVGRCFAYNSNGNIMPTVYFKVTPSAFIVGSQITLAILYKIETTVTTGTPKVLFTSGYKEVFGNERVLNKWTVGFMTIPAITSTSQIIIYSTGTGTFDQPVTLKIAGIKLILGNQVPVFTPDNLMLQDSIEGSTPTTGYHLQGDRVRFNAPAAGGYIGSVCVASGTPGTWKNFGAIQA